MPATIGGIVDKTFRQFALDLHGIWKDLCRKVDPIVAEESHRFSLIALPHPFIAPGGRFRESYYWDAYWIVKGLLVSGMRDTVKGMIRNYAQMVETYGFVPNGGRIYYLQVRRGRMRVGTSSEVAASDAGGYGLRVLPELEGQGLRKGNVTCPREGIPLLEDEQECDGEDRGRGALALPVPDTLEGTEVSSRRCPPTVVPSGQNPTGRT